MKLPSQETAHKLLRISLAAVFLYFGINQAINPSMWASYVPEFFTTQYVSANNLVIMNALLEIVLGISLLIGLYTRIAAFVLSLHLFGIAFSLITTPTGIRDIGLAIATFVVFLNGADSWCLDTKMA